MGDLIGRDADLARVAQALEVTGACCIVGPGGVGKTALARAVAIAAGTPFVIVDAEPLDHLGGLLDAVRAAARVEVPPGDGLAEAVAAAMAEGGVGVVLDGVEHLALELAGLMRSWRPGGTSGRLLVTSRVPIEGVEPVVRLDPLPFDPLDPRGSEVVRLLAARVGRLGGDVAELVDHPRLGELVGSTGGLPLAVELTAAWIARYGVPSSLTGPPGPWEERSTVRSGIDTSVDRSLHVLGPRAARLFELLGVTAGPVSEALLATLGGAPAGTELLRLIDHGLVIRRHGRLDVLPPVRDSAAARFHARDPHARRLTEVVSRAAASMPVEAHEYDEWRFVDAHLDTFVHLCTLARRHLGPGELALRLASGLFEPLHARQRNLDALAVIESVLGRAEDDEHGTPVPGPPLDAFEVAAAARRAGICASESVSVSAGHRWLDRAERAVAGHPLEASMRCRVGSVRSGLYVEAGQLQQAASVAEAAMSDGDPARDGFFVEQARRHLAEAATSMGELDRADDLLGTVYDWAGGRSGITHLFADLGAAWVALERGDLVRVQSLARRVRHEVAADADYVTEVSAEAAMLLVLSGADPAPGSSPVPVDDAALPWVIRLEQRLWNAAELPLDDHATTIMDVAADVAALAARVPLAHTEILGRLVVGDAALHLGRHHQAAVAYESALRAARQGPFRLRCADALDGAAALLLATGSDRHAALATGLADDVRRWCGGRPWRRPTLPCRPSAATPPPAGWLDGGAPTPAAIDAIVDALPGPSGPLRPTRSWSIGLTRAEVQVAELVGEGLTNQQIADRLVVSRRTVESHLARIFQKLGMRTRGQLIAAIHRPGA